MSAERRPPVAHLGPDPAGPGGMAAVTRALLGSPLAERWRLDVIPTYRSPRPLERLAVFAVSLLRLAVWSLRSGGRVVHVHATVRGSMLRKAVVVEEAKLLRRLVVVHVHSGAAELESFWGRIGPLRRRLAARMLRRADAVLAVSEASAAALRLHYGRRDVEVVPNAAPRPRALAAGAARNGSDGELRLLYLGGFANPVKGGRVLVEALPRIAAALPEARVVLAGPGAPPQGLAAPGARWVGWLPPERRDDELARCDVFVLPSLSEGLPMALLEAMALGKAVVATRAGGVPEVVSDGVDGLLVEPGDPAALAAAVARLASDPELRRRLGEGARQRAERLSDHDVADRLDALYRRLGGAE
ncbi:MAG: glycosyltransferase family 4 protein [Thermoleophilaceae bacterium]|nr:glycosyltransferase family 4 protein [Thermoleophilaceae bacterium]